MSDPAAAAVPTSVSRYRLLGFTSGSVVGGLYSTVPGLLVLFYLTDTLAVPASIAGFVVLLPKLWDVVLNPIVGAMSDREALRTGRRTRLMAVGACTLPVAFFLMFSSPYTGMAGAAWVFAAFFLASTAFAVFQVPYVTLPTEMSPSPTERMRIMGWRIIAITLGVLVGGALAPMFVTKGGGGQPGYRLMGIVLGLVLLVMLATATATTRWVRAHAGAAELGVRAAFEAARGNRAFFVLLMTYCLQILGVAMTLASIAYVATYHLRDYGLISTLYVAFVVPSAIAVPLWTRLARRIGKSRAYRIDTIMLALGGVAMYAAISSGRNEAVFAVMLLQGIAFAGQQVLPWAMLPDTILADAGRTGHVQAGTFSGMFTAMETAMFAIGPGVFSLILAVSGFESSTFDAPVAQSSSALSGILLGFTLVPAALVAASLPVISRYERTEAARVGDAPAVASPTGVSP